MTFNVKQAPTVVHIAICHFRDQLEEKFGQFYNAPNSKGRPLWDHFQTRENIYQYAITAYETESFQKWWKEKIPKTGFIAFYNLCHYKLQYLECQAILFGETEENTRLRNLYRSWQEEVREQVEREEEEYNGERESQEAARFERDAYGND